MIRFVQCAVTAALVFSLASCRSAQLTPDPSGGAISIALLERETANQPEAQFKKPQGLVKAAYKRTEGSSTKQIDHSMSFTGTVRVPVLANINAVSVRLVTLTVQNGKEQTVAWFTPAEVSDLVVKAQRGVVVTVIITKDGSLSPEIKIEERGTVPDDGSGSQIEPGNTVYIPVKNIFPDPAEVLTTTDLAGTLSKLKAIASATEEYHNDLFAIIKKANEVDLAHLNLLVDAAYFTQADVSTLKKQLEELSDAGTPDRQEMENLRAKIRVAEALGQFTDQIIVAGIAKAKDLTFDTGMELLKKLFGTGNAEKAFNTVIKAGSPLPAAAKLAVLELASDKNEANVFTAVAIDWFKQDSDRSVATLQALLEKAPYYSKFPITNAGLDEIGSLTFDEAKKLVEATPEGIASIAKKSLGKINGLNGNIVAKLADLVGHYEKDDVVLGGLELLKQLSTAEMKSLIDAAPESKLRIAQLCLSKISGLKGQSVAETAELIGHYEKDDFVLSGLKLLSSVSAAEAASLIAAAPESKLQIGKACLDRLPVLSGAAVASLADGLGYYEKDDFVLYGIEAIQKSGVSVAEAASLIEAVPENKYRVATSCLPRITNLNGTGIAKLNDLLGYYEKDDFTLLAIDRISSFTPKEIPLLGNSVSENRGNVVLKALNKTAKLGLANAREIIQSSDQKKAEIAESCLDKLDVVSAAAIAAMNSELGYYDHDPFAIYGLKKLGRFSTAELVTVADSAQEKKTALLVANFMNTTDLSVSNAVLVADKVGYYEKDTVIGSFVKSLGKVRTADLLALSAAASEKKSAVILQSVSKIADLTVSNAILIAGGLGYYEKDTFLMQAVDAVTDLSATNLQSLSSAASEKQNQILQKGLSRLASHQ